MKKTVLFFALLSSFAACNKQTIDENLPSTKVVLTVRTEAAGAGTSAVLDNFDVKWVAGDAISVFANGVNDKYVTEDSGSNASFVYAGGGTPSSAETLYALAPYSENASIFENVISTNIPNVQKGIAGGVDPSALVMVTKSSTSSFQMKNAVALIKIDIESDNISSVTVASKTGVGMAGATTITVPDEGDPTVFAVDPSILLLPKKTQFAVGTYYIAAAPASLTGGIQVTLTTTDGKVKIANGESDCVLYRSRVKDLGVVETRSQEQTLSVYSLTFSDGKTWSCPFSSPADGDIGTKATFANQAKEATSSTDALVYKFFAKSGISKNSTQGFRWGKTSGDYFRFPVIPEKTLMGVKVVLGDVSCVAGLAQVDGNIVNGGSRPIGTLVAGDALYWFNTNPVTGKQYELRSVISGSNVCIRKIELYYSGSASDPVEPINIVANFRKSSTESIQPFTVNIPTNKNGAVALSGTETVYTLKDTDYKFGIFYNDEAHRIHIVAGNQTYGTGLIVFTGSIDMEKMSYIKFPAITGRKLKAVTVVSDQKQPAPGVEYQLYVTGNVSSQTDVLAAKVGQVLVETTGSRLFKMELSGTTISTPYYLVFATKSAYTISRLELTYE